MKNEHFQLTEDGKGGWLVEPTNEVSLLVLHVFKDPIEKSSLRVNWKVVHEEFFLDNDGEFLNGHSLYREDSHANNSDWEKEVYKDVHKEIFVTTEGHCLVFENIVEKVEKDNKIRYSTKRVLSEEQSLSEMEKEEILQSLESSYEILYKRVVEIFQEAGKIKRVT